MTDLVIDGDTQPAPEQPYPVDPGNQDTDRLGTMLRRARELLEAAMSENRCPFTQEVLPDDRALCHALRQALAQARSTVYFAGADATLSMALGRERNPVLALAGRPVRVRHLYGPAAVMTPAGRDFLNELRRAGGQVRIAPARRELSMIAMLDGSVAILRSVSQGVPTRLMVRTPALLDALDALFTGSWDTAIELTDYLTYADADLDDLSSQILLYLNSGCTDEAAARCLGLSVRTYRRRVAELLRTFNANSRFQAGVRAAELGLLAFHSRPPRRVTA
jgi:DNA-binding NarL/FixJ family response regulator